MFTHQNNHSENISPIDVGYIKRVATSMNRIALWPLVKSRDSKYKFPVKRNLACILYMSILFVLQIFYVKTNIGTINFFQMGHTYITLAMSTICLQRLTMPWMDDYREVAEEFLAKIHLIHKKDNSEYAKKIYNQVEKICYIFTIFVHIQLYGGILLFNVTPWYKNYAASMYSSEKPANETFETACYLELPFDYLTDIYGHIVVFFIGWLTTCIVGSTFCLCHLLLSLYIFHIWGNLKILRHNLVNFPKPQNHLARMNKGWYTIKESERVSTLIVEGINHHRVIIRFMVKTSDAYSFFLLLNYALYQIAGCILLLECSKLDSEALGNYGPLAVTFFQQLIQISVIFELIGTESEMLIDSVYGLPWECMGTRNRKLVLFFLQNVQEPIRLKACGMVPVGVKTMASILKACGSFFIMLRTMATEDIA